MSKTLLCGAVAAAARERDPPAAGRVLAIGGQVLAAWTRRQAAHWARRADDPNRVCSLGRSHSSSPITEWYPLDLLSHRISFRRLLPIAYI